ncbi:hypothetical protein [Nitrosospira sp. NRS527]|uniref:hypothetical protein n=1 Tax=Nitrosospira sp. NRS527 TaxID=155925 RepID=UPI001AFB9898|nr:hypothetical protein [Nitrosospira sp. NRS527]BCT69574.1 hypothetical protein NNRS527_03199 [Nitrosospira sp. NRS527]
MKTWSYAAVTKEAEQLVIELMTKSRQQSESGEAALLRHWAYGVYLLWDRLTRGWRKDGDGERMEALTRKH